MELLPNYLEKLDPELRIFGMRDILNEFHQKHGKAARDDIKNKFHFSTYYYWLKGKSPIPLGILRGFSEYNPEILNKVYSKLRYVSATKKKCILPKEITVDLAYLLGIVDGDGHVHKNKKYIVIAADSKKHVEEILKPLFYKVFKVFGNVRPVSQELYNFEIGSKPVHSFFSLFCPNGRKIGKIKISPLIKKNKKLLIAYLVGLFDADGCIGHTQDGKQFYFTFVQMDKRFTFEVYESLVSLGIAVNKPRIFYTPRMPYSHYRDKIEWRIYIGSKPELNKLLKIIKFLHPEKKEKAIKILIKLRKYGPGRI